MKYNVKIKISVVNIFCASLRKSIRFNTFTSSQNIMTITLIMAIKKRYFVSPIVQLHGLGWYSNAVGFDPSETTPIRLVFVSH